jgi:hypothetical protein
VTRDHKWMLRRIAGAGSLVLVFGILTAFQPGTSRPAAPARAEAAALRVSGHRAAGHRVSSSPVSAIETASPAASDNCFGGDNGHQCLNAWGGGPWVKVSTFGSDDDPNFNFQVDPWSGFEGTNPVQIDFDGTGSGSGKGWQFDCVGDAYNESGYADTSLDPCGLDGGAAAGWGTLFNESSCGNGGYEFYNLHWKGYLAPPSNAVNGSEWYLNTKAAYCFGGY